jgi:sporulation protein YlmC with PRC-barrel domain
LREKRADGTSTRPTSTVANDGVSKSGIPAPATLGVASPAFAQPAASAMVTSDNGLRTSKLIGARVFNQQGDDFGTIDDIVVSPKGGEPIAVLSVGGFLGIGSKLVAVPLGHVRLEGNRMTMAGGSKQELADMNAYNYYHMSNG